MTVLIRADASEAIGTGHVMRCLALAGRLAAAGETPLFVARAMFPGLADRIAAAGFALELLPQTQGRNDREMPHAAWLGAPWTADAKATRALADDHDAHWVVVDHYGIDSAWQSVLRESGRRIAVLDDLADRPHAADLLVDPSLGAAPYGRYRDLLGPECQRLLGPRYAILRPEFADPPPERPARAGLRYLVAFGGVDAMGMTMCALAALGRIIGAEDEADVVVGGQNAALPDIAAACRASGWRMHIDTNAVGRLMAGADLAIGAGGHMLWERAAMGLPSLAVIVADNQREQVREAARMGLVQELEPASNLSAAIAAFASDAGGREAMAAACRAAVDGRGAERIARRIAAPEIAVRPAAPGDRDAILAWRNHPAIRATARDGRAIPAEGHARWFAAVLADPARTLLIGEDRSGPVGVVRFDAGEAASEVSIYLTPKRIGGGQGAALLLAAEAWLAGRAAAPPALVAEVIPGNLPSQALFRAAGYIGNGSYFEKRLEHAP